MNTYGIGTICFLDFPFGGKPSGKVVEVKKSGNGKDDNGVVVVELTETVGAYKKGERLEVGTFTAVPKKQELGLKPGQFYRRVITLYQYE